MQTVPSSNIFTGLLIAVVVLAILIFLPFLTPIVYAIALAVIFGPVYRFILRVFSNRKERSTFGALVTVILIAIVVLIPGFFIVTKLYAEIQDMYYYLTEESGRSSIITFLNSASDWFSNILFNVYQPISFDSLNVTEYFQQALEWGFSHVDTLFTGVGKVFTGIMIAFFALFYFLRDGREFKKEIITLSPLSTDDNEKIFKRLEQAIFSIVAGSLIVGIIQGILTGIGFSIFHVPNPAIWGSVATIAALVPSLGTSLVLIPGILYLFFTGSTFYALGLLIWGLLGVGLVDNFLGPVLINRGMKTHPFIILLSVIGGFSFFGISGFILGPLVFAFLFALLEVYKSSRKVV